MRKAPFVRQRLDRSLGALLAMAVAAIQWVRDQLQKEGVGIALPTGN
jgi:hypothetical protein